VTEGGGFTTMSALSHLTFPFLTNDARACPEQAAYFTMIRILPQVKLLIMIQG
jgi:hypothetical protein